MVIFACILASCFLLVMAVNAGLFVGLIFMDRADWPMFVAVPAFVAVALAVIVFILPWGA